MTPTTHPPIPSQPPPPTQQPVPRDAAQAVGQDGGEGLAHRRQGPLHLPRPPPVRFAVCVFYMFYMCVSLWACFVVYKDILYLYFYCVCAVVDCRVRCTTPTTPHQQIHTFSTHRECEPDDVRIYKKVGSKQNKTQANKESFSESLRPLTLGLPTPSKHTHT